MNTVVADSALGARTIRKMQWRILPFIFLLYVVAYLDRFNIGFAALTMNKDLGISSQQFGFLIGIFFFGYVLFEVPSNLLLHRIGARIWIARILITWGMVALLTGFVRNIHELYAARFLLGCLGTSRNGHAHDLTIRPHCKLQSYKPGGDASCGLAATAEPARRAAR